MGDITRQAEERHRSQCLLYHSQLDAVIITWAQAANDGCTERKKRLFKDLNFIFCLLSVTNFQKYDTMVTQYRVKGNGIQFKKCTCTWMWQPVTHWKHLFPGSRVLPVEHRVSYISCHVDIFMHLGIFCTEIWPTCPTCLIYWIFPRGNFSYMHHEEPLQSFYCTMGRISLFKST